MEEKFLSAREAGTAGDGRKEDLEEKLEIKGLNDKLPEIKSLDFNKAEYQEIILSNSNHPEEWGRRDW